MTASFDLTIMPWIPVQWRPDVAGPTPSEVGLEEALLRAHEIVEIETGSPLETIALNRLLLALSVRVYPETGQRDRWFETWKNGRFNPAPLKHYLDDAGWRERFDLLHPSRPFYQNLRHDASEISSINRLFPEASVNNNPVLFSHDTNDYMQPVPLSRAARGIIAIQVFAVQGGKATPFYYSDAPGIGRAFFWLRGKSLFQALLLNAPPIEAARMGGLRPDDRLTWELDSAPEARKRPHAGFLDYLTWQPRRLCLYRQEDMDGVTGVYFNQGDRLQADETPDEPHAAMIQKGERHMPFSLNAHRALWRDAHLFLMTQRHAQAERAPRTFTWLAANEHRFGPGGGSLRWEADVFGLVNNNADIVLWRHERFPIYSSILNDVNRWEQLKRVQEITERQADRLKRATQAYAVRARIGKAINDRLGDNERRERDELVAALATERRYWSGLEARFFDLLQRLATIEDEGLDVVVEEWQVFLHRAARTSLREATESLVQDARSLQALAEAEMVLLFDSLTPPNRSNNP